MCNNVPCDTAQKPGPMNELLMSEHCMPAIAPCQLMRTKYCGIGRNASWTKRQYSDVAVRCLRAAAEIVTYTSTVMILVADLQAQKVA